MKRFLGIAIVVSSLSIPAFAAKSSQTITLATPVTIGSANLPAGQYKLSWTGNAPEVQVTLEQKNVSKPATATLPAKLVTEKHERTQLTTGSKGGVNTLETIQFKDVTLNFTSAPASGQ
jgi:hypothetical protein